MNIFIWKNLYLIYVLIKKINVRQKRLSIDRVAILQTV